MPRIKNPFAFVFFLLLIDSIGMRMIFPETASIISEVGNVSLDKAATYSGWMMSIYAVLQLTLSPVLGGLSDRFGRRPLLLLSFIGSLMNYLILSFADSITFLFIGRIIGGLCGASLTAGFAYMADISTPEKRARDFGLVGSAIGLGFIIGPFLGGVLSEYGTRIPFIAAAILSFFALICGFFFIPESLKSENRRSFDIKRANLLGTFLHLKKQPAQRKLLLVLFIVYTAGQVLPATWPFYTKLVYGWNDLKIGYSLAFVGLMVAIVKGTLVNWSEVKYGAVHSVFIGLLFNIAGLGLFSLSAPSGFIYLFVIIYCIGGIATPLLQGIISTQTPLDKQGELQGAIISLISLSNIVSPFLMTNLFHFFTKKNAPVYFPGAPYATAAAFVIVAIFIYMSSNKKTTT